MKKKQWFLPCMILMLILQFTTILYFCNLKEGFHYDEFYSYYSSNATNALFMPEAGWKDVDEIRSEFLVSKGESLNLGLVNQMQSLDVHPPLYYFILHIVCNMTKDIFTKWQGISINLLFFVLSWFTMWKITKIYSDRKEIIFSVCLLFGFSPAIFSGVTFIRMYTMLSFECLLLFYFHVKALKENNMNWRHLYMPAAIMTFLGFYTHYYFAVFLFFVAAYTFLYLFAQKGKRAKAFIYAFWVISAGFMVVLIYPACLKHIFRGYRGEEAMGAFFSLGNIVERLNFFFDLSNEYAFGNMLSLLLLFLLVTLLTKGYFNKRYGKNTKIFTKEIVFLTVVVSGYFLVVAKTALMNAEEAIRYELPIYGLMMLLLLIILSRALETIHLERVSEKKEQEKNAIGREHNWQKYLILTVVAFVCLGELLALYHKKVCFLYEDDQENIQWAAENHDATVVYIYNPTNSWMIWDESLELMQYDRIYFCSSLSELNLKDDVLSDSEEIYIYSMRGSEAEEQMIRLCSENQRTVKFNKCRELLYCDLYKSEKLR